MDRRRELARVRPRAAAVARRRDRHRLPVDARPDLAHARRLRRRGGRGAAGRPGHPVGRARPTPARGCRSTCRCAARATECGGRGGTWRVACAPCHGTGYATERYPLTVTVPAGVATAPASPSPHAPARTAAPRWKCASPCCEAPRRLPGPALPRVGRGVRHRRRWPAWRWPAARGRSPGCRGRWPPARAWRPGVTAVTMGVLARDRPGLGRPARLDWRRAARSRPAGAAAGARAGRSATCRCCRSAPRSAPTPAGCCCTTRAGRCSCRRRPRRSST